MGRDRGGEMEGEEKGEREGGEATGVWLAGLYAITFHSPQLSSYLHN